MKTKIFTLSFFIMSFSFLSGSAQNLIPNGDFEQGASVSTAIWTFPMDTDCSYNPYDTLVGLDFWIPNYPDGEPCRFLFGSPFFNCYDNIISHSGTAHIEFNWNDGGKTTLITPLQTGKKYKLKYYLCLDSMWYAYNPQQPYVIFILNNGGNIINSPLVSFDGFGVWKQYDTTFTAIANSTEFEFHGDYIHGTVIYMDDISLLEDTASAIENNSSIGSQPIVVFNSENNAINIIFNNNSINTIIMYNSLGQCIYNSIVKDERAEILLPEQAYGICHVSIISNNQIFSKSILITKNK